MEEKKIPHFNSEFDLRLFLLIARKTLIWAIIIIGFFVSAAFLYLRYTPYVYQTSTIVKLGSEDKANKILNIGNNYFEQNNNNGIASSVELIRSKVIMDRAIQKLPLEISYYKKGKVLSNELYKSQGFTVEYALKNNNAFGQPIYVVIDENKTVQLLQNDVAISPKVKSDSWLVTQYGNFKISFSPLFIDEIKQESNSYQYYFVINNPDKIAELYGEAVTVSLLNDQAQTLEIRVKDLNAKKTADLANAIASEFIKYDLDKKAEGADKTLAFIEKQLEAESAELRSSETIMEAYKRSNKIITPSADITNVIAKVNDLESEKVKLDVEESILAKFKQSINDNTDFTNIISLISGSEYATGVLANNIGLIEKLESDREQLLQQVTPESEQVKIIDNKLKSRKNILLINIDTALKNINDKRSVLDINLKQYDSEITRLPSKEAEYNRIERLFTIHEKFYSLLLEKKTEFLITKAGLVTDNIILQQAQVPTIPISPNHLLIYAFSIVLGFFICLFIILIRYFLHNEISSLEDVKVYTGAAILGMIPKYKDDIPVSELIVDKNPKSAISEAFRSIRSNLQFISNEPGAKLIGITSTVSGEGKTFVAMNLGGVMAFSGKKVILIDLDMRKPKIHVGFNADNNKGISTILIGKDSVEDCIQKSGLKYLDYITAGPIPPNPSELIISPKMDILLDYLGSLYDIVIIDTPPIGLVSDGMSILQRVDYPIYILRSEYSKKYFIQNINKLMTENQMKLSVVLNSVEVHKNKYYDYGYSYSSYGYGYYEELAPTSAIRKLLNKFFKK